MAPTAFQHSVCRLIADNRLSQGESYVAGDAALNVLTEGKRVSRDIDLFHDTVEALSSTWQADYGLLKRFGYEVDVIHERFGFVEAAVAKGEDSVIMQWARDSAFRFFPLVQHDIFGLVLHPFDLATNKTLALVGRLEIRDWIDMISCHDKIQSLGYLVWAACGKDPGFSPLAILEQAKQSNRYVAEELESLSFDGPLPDLADLSKRWHAMCKDAYQIIDMLSPDHVGQCVLSSQRNLYQGAITRLEKDLKDGNVLFHAGTIRGAYPTVLRHF